MGWSGLENGILLSAAGAAGFTVLLTCDRNMQHQQNIHAAGLALVVAAASDSTIETLRQLVPDILALLDSQPQPGTLAIVGTWHT